jgi:hypothetical protein
VCDGMLVHDEHRSILKRTIQELSDTVPDSPATVWTELPEYVFESVVEHLRRDRRVSATFRHVCHAWRKAHDRVVPVLKTKGAPPGANIWKKFGGVKTLEFRPGCSPTLETGIMKDDDLRGLLPSTALASLGLKFAKRSLTRGSMRLPRSLPSPALTCTSPMR